MNAGWLWLIATLVALSLAALAGAWVMWRAQDDDTRALAARVGRLPWRGKARLAWGLLRDSDAFVGRMTNEAQPNYSVAFELPVP